MTTDAALDKDVQDQVAQICRDSRAAARVLATATRATKDAALRAMADELENSAAEIVEANGEDLRRGEENGLTTGLLDRLRLDEARSEEHTSELQSRGQHVCRLLLDKKKNNTKEDHTSP